MLINKINPAATMGKRVTQAKKQLGAGAKNSGNKLVLAGLAGVSAAIAAIAISKTNSMDKKIDSAIKAARKNGFSEEQAERIATRLADNIMGDYFYKKSHLM